MLWISQEFSDWDNHGYKKSPKFKKPTSKYSLSPYWMPDTMQQIRKRAVNKSETWSLSSIKEAGH